MAEKSWVLTDVEQGVFHESFQIGPADAGADVPRFAVTQRRLRGGLSDGVDLLQVDNGLLSVDILPTRGMGLHKARLGELRVGWQSPVRGPVHPQFVPVAEPSGLGWLDGFDELLARCGLTSNGAPEFDEQGRVKYPLHGLVANRPAHRVEVKFDAEKRQITVVGEVDETRFNFHKLRLRTTLITRLGAPTIEIHDEVENLSANPGQMQMLYHMNFGMPLLDAGSRLFAPARTVVPRNERAAAGVKAWNSYAAPTPGFEEQVYFLDLLADDEHRTEVLLANAHGNHGVSLAFNRRQLPCFSVWKNTTAAADGYVTGLEPATNFPNPRSYEEAHERVVQLPPGGKYAMQLALTVHPNGASVDAAAARVKQLAGKIEPQLFDMPQQGWCAP